MLSKSGRTRGTVYKIPTPAASSSSGQSNPGSSGQIPSSSGQMGGSSGETGGTSGQSDSSHETSPHAAGGVINAGRVSSLDPETDPVAFVANKPKVTKDQMRKAILRLCDSDFQTGKSLAEALRRDAEALRKHHLAAMVKEGLLLTKHPDPSDPRQAYKAARS
jgi:hypothetical protein